MKLCPGCDQWKDPSEFYKFRKGKDGKYPRCKACKCADQREYNATHVEENAAYRAANRDRRNAGRVARHRVLRQQALDAYGNKCACCGETEQAFLVFDHVNDDGAEHRKKVNSGLLVWWLAQNDYPDSVQILCANCNTAKQWSPGGCPHGAEAGKPRPRQ